MDFDAEALARRLLERHTILQSKIANALNCETNDVPIALREVMRFLYLVSVHPAGMLTPSHRVDLAWHEFILCTRAYQSFCETHFGKFIHHSPGGSDQENHEQYKETLRLYRQKFGSPDQSFWASEAEPDCGTCEAI